MALRRIEGSVAVITGASSGIGREAARAYARAGARVVLASRDEARLRLLEREIIAAGGTAAAAPTDVTRDEQVASMVEGAIARFGRIDLLVCNAGVGLYAPVAGIPGEALRRVFEVNFHGVVRCVQRTLPHMLSQGSGLIQIVSSVIGLRAVPGYAGYCASKFALGALAESLRVELAGTGVGVQVIYPGLTDTEFQAHAILRDPAAGSQPVTPMSAEAVARRMVRAARRGSRDLVISAGGRFLTSLNRISPRLVDLLLARWAARRRAMGPDAVPD